LEASVKAAGLILSDALSSPDRWLMNTLPSVSLSAWTRSRRGLEAPEGFPKTGLEKISGDLLEADFWSRKICLSSKPNGNPRLGDR
jgi:hypothetical protein